MQTVKIINFRKVGHEFVKQLILKLIDDGFSVEYDSAKDELLADKKEETNERDKIRT
jgi:hypothetical protein